MELSSRVELMNWLVGQGLTGLPEPDLLRGFSERCRAGGLDISRVLAFIDTLHPIYEGRGFRWNSQFGWLGSACQKRAGREHNE